VLGPAAGCFSRVVRWGKPSICPRRAPWPWGKEHRAAASPASRALAGATAPARHLARAPVPPHPRAASPKRRLLLAPVSCRAAMPEHTEEEDIGEGLTAEKEGRCREDKGVKRRKRKEEERKNKGRGKKKK
jgi:hypothetical protein